jgi:hypothetical protein
VTTRHAFLLLPFGSCLDTGRRCSRCRRDLVSRWPYPALHRLACISPLDGPVGQISPDKNVNCPYPLNPGLCHVVLAYPGTRPCMLFLFPSAGSGQAWLTALRSGFLQTVPRGSTLAFG